MQVNVMNGDPVSSTLSSSKDAYIEEDAILSHLPQDFQREDFNPMKYILENLPEKPDIAHLDNILFEKDRMLDAVNSKLSALIMNSYGAFVQGMSQIHELDVDLQQSAVMCRTGRSYLRSIKEELTNPSLMILAKYRKQQAFLHIMNELVRMKAMLEEEATLKRLIAEGDYPSAISKCISCQAQLGSLLQYHGVQGLRRNFGEYYKVTQDRLDETLQQLCCTFPFSPTSFQKVVAAYRILGKPERMLERLQPFFVDTVESHTTKIVKSHVLLSDVNRIKPETFKNMPLRELCASIDEEQYGECLRAVLEYLCDLLAAHHSMNTWLENSVSDVQGGSNEEKLFNNDLLSCLGRIVRPTWDNMQRIVTLLLLACKPGFKIEEFLKTLDLVYQFIEFGEEFSGNVRANTIRNSVYQQSRVYFTLYHKSRMDDLRTMMEHEMWHRCPLQPDFTLYDVKEFRAGLRRDVPVYSNSDSKPTSVSSRLATMCSTGNPFAKSNTPSPQSNNHDKGDYDSDLELRAEIHRKRSQSTDEEPLLTPTTINAVRFMGRYLQLMRLLPNPHLVWKALTQLFEYYLFSVYILFCPVSLDQDIPSNSKDSAPNLYSTNNIAPTQLKRTLQRLRAAFDMANISNQSAAQPLFSASSIQPLSRDDGVTVKCGVPRLSENVNLASAKDLFGMSLRIVAIESLRFLTDSLKEALPLAQTLIPNDKLSELNEFYSDIVSIVPDIRSHMYRVITHAFINFEQIQHSVGATKWELKELGLEHSGYVDNLLRDFRDLSRRMDDIERENDKFPASVRRLLWEYLVAHAMEALVEGYSRVKKCNNEGRALMSLDLKIFTHSLQNLINSTSLRPPPNITHSVSLVESYIKAFYLPPSELVVFSKDHPEYTSRQIQAIITCNPGNTLKKKQKQEIFAVLDDIEKSRVKR